MQPRKIEILADHDAGTGILQQGGESHPRFNDFLTVKEHDKIIHNETLRKKFYPASPFLTGAYLKYGKDGNGEITEHGKTVKCKVPEKNGWYKQDARGMPFGAPSAESDPEARYLYRQGSFSGLVFRWYYGGRFYDGRRSVGCYDLPDFRFGVLAWEKPRGKKETLQAENERLKTENIEMRNALAGIKKLAEATHA